MVKAFFVASFLQNAATNQISSFLGAITVVELRLAAVDPFDVFVDHFIFWLTQKTHIWVEDESMVPSNEKYFASIN